MISIEFRIYMKVFIRKDNLKRSLLRRNISRKVFCEKIGITPIYFKLLLEGERNPSPELRIKICDELNLKFDYLFCIK